MHAFAHAVFLHYFKHLFILTFIINTRVEQSFVTSRQLTQIDQKRL